MTTLSSRLAQYLDKVIENELLKWLKFGLPLNYSRPRLPTNAINLKSALEKPDVLEAQIEKDLSAGRVSGLYQTRPPPTLQISPLGLVLKKDGNFRVYIIYHILQLLQSMILLMSPAVQ